MVAKEKKILVRTLYLHVEVKESLPSQGIPNILTNGTSCPFA